MLHCVAPYFAKVYKNPYANKNKNENSNQWRDLIKIACIMEMHSLLQKGLYFLSLSFQWDQMILTVITWWHTLVSKCKKKKKDNPKPNFSMFMFQLFWKMIWMLKWIIRKLRNDIKILGGRVVHDLIVKTYKIVNKKNIYLENRSAFFFKTVVIILSKLRRQSFVHGAGTVFSYGVKLHFIFSDQ